MSKFLLKFQSSSKEFASIQVPPQFEYSNIIQFTILSYLKFGE